MCKIISQWGKKTTIKSLEGSPVPSVVRPLVALYLEGVYQEAWGSCWEAVVPLAFPLEGNEVVFPVVPSSGWDTDRQTKNRKFKANTDCNSDVIHRKQFSPWLESELNVKITQHLSLTYKWGRYPWGRYTWIRWRMSRTIISLRWRLSWMRDTTES